MSRTAHRRAARRRSPSRSRSSRRRRRAADAAQLTEIEGADVPRPAYVLSLPPRHQGACPSTIAVVENGQPVDGLRSSLPGDAAAASGIVLAIDASESMKGAPIVQAMAAARAFAAQRADDPRRRAPLQRRRPRSLPGSPPTTLRSRARSRGTPKLAFGTHIYDAIAEAQQMLADGRHRRRLDRPPLRRRRRRLRPRRGAGGRAREPQRTHAYLLGRASSRRQFDDVDARRGSAPATGGSFAAAARPRELTSRSSPTSAPRSRTSSSITLPVARRPPRRPGVRHGQGRRRRRPPSPRTPPPAFRPASSGTRVAGGTGSIQSPWTRGAAQRSSSSASSFLAVYRDRARPRPAASRTACCSSPARAPRSARPSAAPTSTRSSTAEPQPLARASASSRRFLEDAELAGIRPTPPDAPALRRRRLARPRHRGGARPRHRLGVPARARSALPLARWYASFRLKRVRKAVRRAAARDARRPLLGAARRPQPDRRARPSPSRRRTSPRAASTGGRSPTSSSACRSTTRSASSPTGWRTATSSRSRSSPACSARPARTRPRCSTTSRTTSATRWSSGGSSARSPPRAGWHAGSSRSCRSFLFVVLFLLNREYLRPLWEEPLGKVALVVAAVLIVDRLAHHQEDRGDRGLTCWSLALILFVALRRRSPSSLLAHAYDTPPAARPSSRSPATASSAPSSTARPRRGDQPRPRDVARRVRRPAAQPAIRTSRDPPQARSRPASTTVTAAPVRRLPGDRRRRHLRPLARPRRRRQASAPCSSSSASFIFPVLGWFAPEDRPRPQDQERASTRSTAACPS